MKVNTVFGPPGTGKTRTLTDVAAHYLRKGQHVTLLSFSKAAATESASRMADSGNKNSLSCTTIHSLAFSSLGLARPAIVDNRKMQEFGNAAGFAFKDGKEIDEDQEGDEFQNVLSYSNAKMIDPMEAFERFGCPGTLKRFEMFLKSYAQWKDTFGYFDFDDMLSASLTCDFGDRPIVILDEAQDCSPQQWRVFKKIVENSKDVYIGGDDDQAIFEWNGADPHGMIDFSENHHAKIKVLDQSYRLPRAVHDYAEQHALKRIGKRVPKAFKAADREGSVSIFGEMFDVHLSAYAGSDTLVLVRDRFKLKEIQTILNQDRVPYKIIGGGSPYDNAYAAAVRGYKRDGGPNPNEKAAIMKLAYEQGATVETIMKTPWHLALKIPARLIHFYSTADLFAPLTLRISTVHQAKGMEADNVLIDANLSPRVEEGMSRDPDAEARVFYVALTRARKDLTITGWNGMMSK